MKKRRLLSPDQKIIIIFRKDIGYVEEQAVFKEYRRIIYADTEHKVPVFQCEDKELTGLECFWVLLADIKTPEQITKIQRELIGIQIKANELSQQLDYKMPSKIDDSQIDKIAAENVDRMQAVIDKFGFDPRDELWIDELSANNREKNWFEFEHDNALVFSSNWDDVVVVFNKEFNDKLSIEDAKRLSKKRMRYLLGAYNTRLSGNANKEDWKTAATRFEEFHRQRENRMLTWSLLHKDNFPLVRVKKSTSFFPGPFIHECMEKIPRLFTNIYCRFIKEGVVLRVLSYDKQERYIRLDFTPDIRKLLKPKEPDDVKLWLKDRADYDIWLKPEEINTHLEILTSLD